MVIRILKVRIINEWSVGTKIMMVIIRMKSLNEPFQWIQSPTDLIGLSLSLGPIFREPEVTNGLVREWTEITSLTI